MSTTHQDDTERRMLANVPGGEALGRGPRPSDEP